MRCIAAALAALALAGCDTTDSGAVLSLAPVDNARLPGNYAQIADCTYQALASSMGAGLRKADLASSSTSVIGLDSGGVQYWQLTLKGEGADTVASLSVVRTMWGPDNSSSARVMAAARGCATPGR